MLKSVRFLLLLIALFATPLLHAETADIQSVQADIRAFEASADYAYAPATIARAQAFLGAAILADEQNNQDEVDAALARALETLQQARDNAGRFRQQHASLLQLGHAAADAVSHIRVDDPLSTNNPKQLFKKAEFDLATAIKASEAGELNNSQQAAISAEEGYRKAIEYALPQIIDLTGETLSRAAAAGAKNYVPTTYGKAIAETERLQRYVDGITTTLPLNPTYALSLAMSARDITMQVKAWRRSYDSHESLFLKSRDERLTLARRLGIAVDENDARADVLIEQLTTAIDRMTSALKQAKSEIAEQKKRMLHEHETRLAAALAEQREALLGEREVQLGSLKEAFRAKLEQETFESKRREKIGALFKTDEAEVLANVDGSLLIRLSGLRFASGSSKIDPASYDLLGRLKRALELYGERKIRIEGHTDSQGDLKINQAISLKRAEAVRDFLIAADLNGSRLKALGYGEVRPIASNEFEKGRAMNRRIDIVIEMP